MEHCLHFRLRMNADTPLQKEVQCQPSKASVPSWVILLSTAVTSSLLTGFFFWSTAPQNAASMASPQCEFIADEEPSIMIQAHLSKQFVEDWVEKGIAHGILFTPKYDADGFVGTQIAGISPRHPFYTLGLRNKDVILSLGNPSPSNANVALEQLRSAYRHLTHSTEAFTTQITFRRGQKHFSLLVAIPNRSVERAQGNP